MSVWYLELDDEITDAVARLRAAKDDRVVFVVPAGSRIGTGRINFRLLAREAVSRDLRIALVSGDPQVRALAASAGLPTYASVGESERGAATEGPLALDATDGSPEDGTDATATITTAPGPGSGIRTAGSRPVRQPRSRRRKAAMAAGALGLALVVGGGTLLALYRAVPTAQITLALAPRALGPVPIAISVSAAEQTDPETGAVQGQLAPVTIERTVVVTATDTQPLGDRAKGSVTFTNASHTTVPIPDQTRVATVDGVEFVTQWAIRGIAPGASERVDVRAARQGEEGNVEAGTITVIVEPGLAAQLSGWRGHQPRADLGRDHRQHPRVQPGRLRRRRHPADGRPHRRPQDGRPGARGGHHRVPGTAQQRGVVVVDQAASDIVGAIGPNTAVGQPWRQRADGREGSGRGGGATPAGRRRRTQLRGPRGAHRPGRADHHRRSRALSGHGQRRDVRPPGDHRRAAEEVRSKTILEAQRILRPYGTATITLSPDFLPALPDDPSRIEIRAEPPAPGATPIPTISPSPGASATPHAATPAPGASASAPATDTPAPGASASPSPVPGAGVSPHATGTPVPGSMAPSVAPTSGTLRPHRPTPSASLASAPPASAAPAGTGPTPDASQAPAA
ncbi:MAG: baseplate J/gp47 family protein [Chloroflexota bacterium]